MIFTRTNKASRPGSSIAMALVLAATGALGVAALEAPAVAKQDKEKEAKPEYSKDFLAAYSPLDQALKAETPDYAAAKALVPALEANVKSADEKRAAGGLIFNLANSSNDADLRLKGIELMLASGKVDADLGGQLSFAAYQAYKDAGNIPAARTALEGAIESNYAFTAQMSDGSQRTIGATDMQRMIADLYFDQEQYAEGLSYISEQIKGLQDAGQPVPETLIRTGLSKAYENSLNRQSIEYVALLAENYPTDTTWGDAVIITLNANTYENPEVLDLLRLSRRTGAYNDARVLSEYVEVLDARRYPGEVLAAIDEGIAKGIADGSDPYLAETRREAAGRVETDRKELAGLAADARAGNATLKTLVVAGDTFLSYDKPAEAEEFYTKALGMSGVETPMVLTRLGIAQHDQGKYAEAIETFGKVEGARRDLANLWAIYTAQKSAM